VTCYICVVADIRVVEICDSLLRTGTICSRRVERGEGGGHFEFAEVAGIKSQTCISSQETNHEPRSNIWEYRSIRKIVVVDV
jgi:hypothetical protein